VQFNSTGDRLVAATLTGSTAVWAVGDEEPGDGPFPRWRRVDSGELDGSTTLRFSRDGRWLATAEASGDVRLRDPGTYEILTTLPAELEFAGQNVFAFSSDGERLVITGRENAELWDIGSKTRIGDPFPNDPTFWAVASDGPHIATAVGEWAMIWNLDPSTWAEIACNAAGRNMTPSEWRQFGPAGAEYQLTCERWPTGVDDSGIAVIGQEDIDRSLSQTQDMIDDE
jgi:WD40 repeat protein